MKISYSKSKALKLFLGSIVFVVMGFYFILFPEEFPRISIVYISILGFITVAFFGLGIYVSIRMFFQKTPNFEINGEGITYDIKESSTFIAWKNIEGFSEVKIHGQEIILVHLRNPEDYILREKNFLKKNFLEFNYKNYNTPISILPSMYNISLDQLKAYFEKYSQK